MVVAERGASHIPTLRKQYIDEVNSLSKKADELRKKGLSEKEIAKILNKDRLDIGKKYKDLTPSPLKEEIYARNLERYGNKWGPNIEYLRNKGKSWTDIIKGASKTGGSDIDFNK